MRVKDVAARLEVSPGTVYGLIASGKLRCYRVGNGRGVVRISEEQFSAFLKRSEPQVPAPNIPRASFKLKHLRMT